MKIKKATIEDLDVLVPLFDAYRMFYKQDSDKAAAHKFLKDRLEKNQSTIFIACSENQALGFTQLYPIYSSVSLESMCVLNDIFVYPDARGKGLGALLLETAKNYATENQLKGLSLETAIDNPAQYLYERLGWKKDTDFFHYFWKRD